MLRNITAQNAGALIMCCPYRMNPMCQIKDFNRKKAKNPILQKFYKRTHDLFEN